MHFTYNGRDLQCEEGLTISEALRSCGVEMGSRSFRLRRWRDEPHPLKETPSAWVTVNGVPDVNAFRTRIADGMNVESQSRWHPLSVAGKYAGAGFYYRHFTRSEFLRRIFFNSIRKVSDYGGNALNIPEQAGIEELSFEEASTISPDKLIVGAGRSGLGALAALTGSNGVLIVDAMPRTMLEANFAMEAGLVEKYGTLDALLKDAGAQLIEETTVIGAYPGPLFCALKQERKVLFIRPNKTLLCVGSEEIKPLFRGNDLPGVVTAHTLRRFPLYYKATHSALYIEDRELLPHLRILNASAHFRTIILKEQDESYLKELQTIFPASEIITGEVQAAYGARHVETIRLSGGRRRFLRCDLLVIAGRRQPRIELPSLLGAAMRFEESYCMPVPITDTHYRCDSGVYVCGSTLSPHLDTFSSGLNAAIAMMGREHAPPPTSASAVPCIAKAPANQGVVCFCLDVTARDMQWMASNGYNTLNRMKRFSGLFMGPCQGARCFRNACEHYRNCTGLQPELTTIRPPLMPVYIGALAAGWEEYEKGV
ncbi:MAG: 2Fe-2S iron-sulfur cluster-binding protein [Methanomassiliicoccales archaeon]